MNVQAMAKRAAQVLASRRSRKTETVHVKSLEADLVFHSLTAQERAETLEAAREDNVVFLHKLIYAASDDLRRLALELKDQGALEDYEDVVELFSADDQLALVRLINRLSGVGGPSDLEFDGREALKNS